MYGRFEERQYLGVEPTGRGPGGVLVGLPGRGVGPADAQVESGLAGRFLGVLFSRASLILDEQYRKKWCFADLLACA